MKAKVNVDDVRSLHGGSGGYKPSPEAGYRSDRGTCYKQTRCGDWNAVSVLHCTKNISHTRVFSDVFIPRWSQSERALVAPFDCYHGMMHGNIGVP